LDGFVFSGCGHIALALCTLQVFGPTIVKSGPCAF
jgi:hypothetical protein